jgi:outer membrane protein TolC
MKVMIFLLPGVILAAQTIPPVELTLSQAIEESLKYYPSIRISQEQMNAAAAEIQLARTAYLPRVDGLTQINRATRNNVFGLLLPQSVIPSMSGPVIGTNNLGSVWSSAVGGLVSWEPFDFGLRHASVAAARSSETKSEAAIKKTQFDVAVSAADAYLTAVAARETARAAHAGVDRAEALATTIHAQVKAELRPGADESRAEAELAAARTQLAQAEQAIDMARSLGAVYRSRSGPLRCRARQPDAVAAGTGLPIVRSLRESNRRRAAGSG